MPRMRMKNATPNNGGDPVAEYTEPVRDKPMINVAELESKTLNELREMAKAIGVTGVSNLKKQDLIFKLLQMQTEEAGHTLSDGVLDIVADGYGFLRGERMLPGPDDVYVSQSQIRRFGCAPATASGVRSVRQRRVSATTRSCASRWSTGWIQRRRGNAPRSIS